MLVTRRPTSQPCGPQKRLARPLRRGAHYHSGLPIPAPLICLHEEPKPISTAPLGGFPEPMGFHGPHSEASGCRSSQYATCDLSGAATGDHRLCQAGLKRDRLLTPAPCSSLMGEGSAIQDSGPHTSALPAWPLHPGPPAWPRHCPPNACPVGPPGHPAAHHSGAPLEPTSQLLQGVVAAFLRAREVAAAIEEVGPGHVDGIEGGLAGLAQRPADMAAGSPHAAALAARGQHGAAQQAQVGVALALQEVVQHAQEDVLRAGLHGLPGPVRQQRGEGRPGVGDVTAGLQLQVHARGWGRGGDGGVTRALPPTMTPRTCSDACLLSATLPKLTPLRPTASRDGRHGEARTRPRKRQPEPSGGPATAPGLARERAQQAALGLSFHIRRLGPGKPTRPRSCLVKAYG